MSNMFKDHGSMRHGREQAATQEEDEAKDTKINQFKARSSLNCL